MICCLGKMQWKSSLSLMLQKVSEVLFSKCLQLVSDLVTRTGWLKVCVKRKIWEFRKAQSQKNFCLPNKNSTWKTKVNSCVLLLNWASASQKWCLSEFVPGVVFLFLWPHFSLWKIIMGQQTQLRFCFNFFRWQHTCLSLIKMSSTSGLTWQPFTHQQELGGGGQKMCLKAKCGSVETKGRNGGKRGKSGKRKRCQVKMRGRKEVNGKKEEIHSKKRNKKKVVWRRERKKCKWKKTKRSTKQKNKFEKKQKSGKKRGKEQKKGGGQKLCPTTLELCGLNWFFVIAQVKFWLPILKTLHLNCTGFKLGHPAPTQNPDPHPNWHWSWF